MDDPNKVTYFGETDSRNKRVAFGIKSKDRAKHMYVIGKTGMGKSTLLENLAIQDIQNGNGVAFIDPHGGTAEKLLEYIPQERLKDVLYFAPFDLEHPVSFNVMEDVGADKRHLVVNGLMSTFEKIWVDAWSARMAYILNNTLLALLEFPGATLLGVNRMLADKEYRKKVVSNVKDPSVKAFWTEEFAGYTEKFAAEATPAIQNKVGQFTSNPLVRNLIGQSVSTFDIRKFMDEKKILIVNLSKGRVGEGNANLIGSMLITKIYLAAMSRADRSEAELQKLPNFYLYVDEFQSFANKSFADILSEARKYKLNLTIAHQYIEQMEEEVRDAVFGNVGTMIAFRVGAFDAEVLEKEFAPTFTAEDLVNLGFTQVYLKLMIDGVSSQPFSATTTAPIPRPAVSYKEEAIANSRAQYTKPRAEVEKNINDWHEEGKVERPARAPERSERPMQRSTDRPADQFERGGDRRSPMPRRSEPMPIDMRGKREETKIKKETPLPPVHDDFKPLASISLADFNKKNDNQRQPSPKNISDLRSVLANIVKAEPKPSPAPAPVQKSAPQAHAKEVPEAELRALLGVEE
ncbi:MAG: type IV secretory system conjugative DNA transfer family protein [Patescibacteria group bacterium]